MATGRHTPRDEELISRTLKGDNSAFNALIERYFGMVYVLAFSRVDERETAEDLTQEVFLRAYLHLSELREPRYFGTWIGRIARNLGTSWAKRHQRSSRLVPMVPLDAVEDRVADPDAKGVRDAMEAHEQDAALRDALRQLSPEQRDLVLLRYAENLNQQEIAERLGVNQSTVSRQISQALATLRGHVEAILVESAPRLRAPSKAPARVVTLIAAVGAMSATSKATLAAASSIGVVSGSSKAAGGAIGLFSLLKSIPAMIAGGGAAMGFGKGVAAVVIAGAVIGGGVYVMNRDGGGGGSSSAPSPASDPAPSAQVANAPTTPASPPAASWEEWMRDFLRDHPDNEGLAALVDTVDNYDSEAVLPSQTLKGIIENGWQQLPPDIMARMRAQSSAMQSAIEAAMADDIEFPAMTRVSDPMPNFLTFQQIGQLICVDARRLEASGDIRGAAQRAVQCARLGEHLIEDEVALIQNLIGIAVLSNGIKVLENLLASPRMTPDIARTIQAELARISRSMQPASALLQTEGRLLPNTVQAILNGELGPESGMTPSQIQQMIGGDFDHFMTVHTALWNTILENMDRPAWQREEMDEDWFRQHSNLPFHSLAAPNFAETVTRWETDVAHLRLCQTLAALADGEVQSAERIPADPFDGQSIRVEDNRVWSVGPDGEDGGGRTQYDPTNGTNSAGDIIARR